MKAGTPQYALTILYTDDMGGHVMTRESEPRVPPTDIPGTLSSPADNRVLAFIGYRSVPAQDEWEGKFPWERKSEGSRSSLPGDRSSGEAGRVWS